MKFKDLLPKAQEYHNLTDIVDKVEFQAPPPLPNVCPECGRSAYCRLLGWAEIYDEITKFGHGDKEYQTNGVCATCAPEDDDS